MRILFKAHLPVFAIAVLFGTGGLLQSAQALHLPDSTDPYDDIPHMHAKDLHNKLDEYLIVDVRTKYEFEVLHLKGAISIPYHKASFARLLTAEAKKSGKPIVFYCNGAHELAFKAARSAKVNRLTKIAVLEDTLLHWAKTYPAQSVLNGKSPVKVADLISDEKFAARTIDSMTFESTIKKNVNVIDVRSYREREGVAIFEGFDSWLPLEKEKRLKNKLKDILAEGKPLLIYDDKGVRTRWLQYTLEEMGFKDYHFMRGGVQAYNKMISGMHRGRWNHGQFQTPAGAGMEAQADHQMNGGQMSSHDHQH